jgi:hypothetical protein
MYIRNLQINHMQAKREGVKWENKQVDTLEAFWQA